jgi:uncharacterized protein (TIGR02145 family)
MWTGVEWELRRMYGCPYPGACNYIGNWSYPVLPDVSSCLFPGNGCPFTSCDDGNSLTYDDVWDSSGWNCYGTYCDGNCAALPCDDGDAITFGESWDELGSICSGGQICDGTAVDCSGAGPCSGVPFVFFDAKQYALVEIGNQCWFKENLASDNYRNGDPIPGDLSDFLWQNTNKGAQAISDETWGDVSVLGTYGRLYNGYATQDSRGLCPMGFHVPSDEDWMTLEMAMGMTQAQANDWGWRGTDQATQMKASPSDSPYWDGSNTSGFSGLPAGFRNYNGSWYNLGFSGHWWSSSPYYNHAFNRVLYSGFSQVLRFSTEPQYGLSVRCVKD